MNLYESMGRISVGGVKREQISSKGRLTGAEVRSEIRAL